MWRLLLIFGIIGYILYKVGNFFFKIGAASQQMKDRERVNRPDESAKKSKIKGGEYVDYEDVK